jgi:hypothetical protein
MQHLGKRLVSNVQTLRHDVMRTKKAVPDALSEVYVSPIFGHRLLEL